MGWVAALEKFDAGFPRVEQFHSLGQYARCRGVLDALLECAPN